MKTIETEFDSYGFHFEQVFRKGNAAIYRQSMNGKTIAFEVVKIRKRAARRLPNGEIYPESEIYPSPAEWGKAAWTCVTLEMAFQKLNSVPGLVGGLVKADQTGQSGTQDTKDS
jgi:hypothetical protein